MTRNKVDDVACCGPPADCSDIVRERHIDRQNEVEPWVSR